MNTYETSLQIDGKHRHQLVRHGLRAHCLSLCCQVNYSYSCLALRTEQTYYFVTESGTLTKEPARLRSNSRTMACLTPARVCHPANGCVQIRACRRTTACLTPAGVFHTAHGTACLPPAGVCHTVHGCVQIRGVSPHYGLFAPGRSLLHGARLSSNSRCVAVAGRGHQATYFLMSMNVLTFTPLLRSAVSESNSYW